MDGRLYINRGPTINLEWDWVEKWKLQSWSTNIGYGFDDDKLAQLLFSGYSLPKCNQFWIGEAMYNSTLLI